MDISELGQAILLRRKKIQMSQAQLAAANGMSRATISALENGRLAELGVRKVLALCATLGLKLELTEVNTRPTLRDLIEEKNRA
jgi:HTH-type transcriptional regulator / antitoxin HipB